MRRVFYFGLFLLLHLGWSTTAWSKTIVLNKHFTSLYLQNEVELFTDSSCSVSIDRIHDAKIPWQAARNTPLGFVWPNQCYWYKFSINNPGQNSRKLVLEVTNFQIDSLDFLTFENKRLVGEYYTGNGRGFISRQLYDRNFLFELSIPSGKTYTYYFKIFPQANLLNFPVTIWNAKKKYHQSRILELSKGILIGVVISFFSIAIYLSVIMKIWNYMVYAIHVFIGTFYYFLYEGIGLEFFWMEKPDTQVIVTAICLQLFLISTIYFLSQFVRFRMKVGKWIWAWRLLYGTSITFIFLNLFYQWMPLGGQRIFLFSQHVYLLVHTFVVVCFLVVIILKIKEKALFFMSMAFYLIMSLIITNPFFLNQVSPASKVYLTAMYASGWVVAMLILFLVLYRSKALLKASKRNKAVLSTLNKKYGFNLMEGGEKERWRIAEELHDGIGISLAALKMKFSLMMSETEDLELIRKLGPILKKIDNQCTEVRNLSHNLREKSLERYGLEVTIRDYMEQLSQKKKIKHIFRQNIRPDSLNSISESTIYRISKGLLTEVWNREIDFLELRLIVFYATEKAIIKLNTQGASYTLSHPDFSAVKTIIDVLQGDIMESSPNAFTKEINIEIPIIVKSE